MDHDALLSEYKRLKKENVRLREENIFLRARLEKDSASTADNIVSAQQDAVQTCSVMIDQNSPSTQKIELFMSLFRGRRDVYARRWVNHKKGTAGYSPACAHEWRRPLCQKPKVKCTTCPNQKFMPYDVGFVKAHLMGQVAGGVYPLLKDETCYFLAIDFDEGNWQKNIISFREACRDWGVICAVERSRSGNGAHVWFFFETAISASLARKFGSALLTCTMIKEYRLGLDSYDKLFPSQDTLPEGGLGNLIALPFQKEAREAGNCVFVDEKLEQYPDQWAYLGGIKKLTAEQVEEYVKKMAVYNELGPLMQEGSKNYRKPWLGRDGTAQIDLAGLPPAVTISRANMLYIPKRGLSSKALNRIIRMAAFKNPEFYRRQAMRLPTYDYPRVIHLEEEFEDHIAIPRGCDDELLHFFDGHGVKAMLEDETNPGIPIRVAFTGELTDLQKEAGKTLLNYDHGVLAAPPGFGKTVLGAWLIGKRKVNTLILVHLKHLLEQWKERLSQFLNIEETLPEEAQPRRGRPRERRLIGEFSGGKDRRSGLVDIALIQSLYTRGQEGVVDPCLRDYGMVIVDECHHISAFSFEKVIKAAHAKYVYGLTATPKRQDGHHPIIFMHCGPIRYKVDALSQSKERPFEHMVLPRFTSFKMPPKIGGERWHIQKIYTAITESETRNHMIIQDVLKAAEEGRNSIILAHRTAHVRKLAEMLNKKGVEGLVLTGQLKDRQRAEVRNRLEECSGERPPVIVATGKYIGEGFDYAPLDTLFLASPVAWHGTVQQYIGRLHRLYDPKQEVRVIDYVDIHEYVLEKMYDKRLKAYTAAGYTIKAPDEEGREVDVLYSQINYWDTYSKDISSACDRIFIASPFVNQRQVGKMLPVLKPVLERGVQVTVLTRPVSDYRAADIERTRKNLEYLQDAGIMISFQENMFQRFAVVDYDIVWYGSISFLGYSKKEANVMRINNRALAVEITGTISKGTQ